MGDGCPQFFGTIKSASVDPIHTKMSSIPMEGRGIEENIGLAESVEERDRRGQTGMELVL